MISKLLHNMLIKLKLNTSRNIARLEMMYVTVHNNDTISGSEYAEKDAFRVHSCDDNNKTCLCGGVVVPLIKDSNVIGICMTTETLVIGHSREHNEWNERYVIYEHML